LEGRDAKVALPVGPAYQPDRSPDHLAAIVTLVSDRTLESDQLAFQRPAPRGGFSQVPDQLDARLEPDVAEVAAPRRRDTDSPRCPPIGVDDQLGGPGGPGQSEAALNVGGWHLPEVARFQSEDLLDLRPGHWVAVGADAPARDGVPSLELHVGDASFRLFGFRRAPDGEGEELDKAG